MSITLKPFLLPFIAVSLFIAGCNENDSDDDFPDQTGIQGKVLVQNEFGQPLYEERNGISVLLETGFRSYDLDADNVGYWQVGGAPVGSYTITYKKTGCGTIIARNVLISTTSPVFEVIGGFQQMATPTLTKLANASFSGLNLDLTTNVNGGTTTYTLDVSGTIIPGPPPTGQAKGYRVFLARTSTVSKDNYEFQQHATTTTAAFTTTIDSSVLSELNVVPGQTLYVAVYGDSNFDFSQERPNGSFAFPNLSIEPSAAISVVLP